MYTTIRLRNVRAWADSGDIALAPLTLFYGANGAGKSSIAQALDALARIADRGFTDPAALVAALPADAVRDMIRDRDPTRLIGIDLAWQPDASMQAALVQGARRLAVSVELGLDPAGRPRLHGLHWTVTDRADRPLRVVAVHDGHPVDKDAAAIDVLAAATAAAVGGFVMLGPLRARPRRSYAVPARVPADVGPRGQGAVPAMAAADRAGRRLSIGDGAARGFADMISDRLATLGLVAGVELVDAPGGVALIARGRRGGQAPFAEAGFGLSQVLPAAVAAFLVPAGSTLWLEQPELHLHAAAQAALGDLLIDALEAREAGRARHLQILVETHSEPLLNRIQRRIAEARLSAERVAVHWCPGTVPATIERLEMDETGEILNWPDDVFGDEMADVTARAVAAAARRKARRAGEGEGGGEGGA
ncbi:AAA family ATPase (plasmid) [Tistrella mobilis]|uniref:AAA family ATPase n=1 Tax=Tistrella mobilis TaxID=171437 RepID=UPI003557D800